MSDVNAAASPTGLTTAEVARRRAAAGANVLPEPPPLGLPRRLAMQLREPMSLLLIAAAAVSGFGLGERLDAVAIAAIVVLNAAIATVQEGRAASALAALGRLQTPVARVRRDGRVQQAPAADLVPGDVVLLEAGDRVPADLRLTAASGLEVDESTLTGESVPVAKHAEPPTVDERSAEGVLDQPARAFTGTLVTRGSAEGVAVATAANTALGRIAGALRTAPPPTPLQRELASLAARLGIAAVVIAAAVLALILARTGLSAEALERAFLAAVALAVAAVPEGLASVTLVALALGVRRMAAQRALIRRLPAVETLGAATVIVTDKTGTVTENRMRVQGVAAGASAFVPPEEVARPLRDPIDEVGILCNDAAIDPPVGDPMERALLEAAGADRVDRLRATRPRLGALPFDTRTQRMAVLVDGPTGPRLLVKGAPERVLERCTTVLQPGGPQPLDDAEREALLQRVALAAADGSRVLAFATRQLAEAPDDLEAEVRDLCAVALVDLYDPVRREATAAVREAVGAGVRVLMATGDHPATASAIAEEIGLTVGEQPVLTGAALRAGGLPGDPLTVPVYARVEPEQKLALVEALQQGGEVVAMTGDGVNDAPALRRADIGIALGARGSDVAREAADMVITDDNLATIVAATREGRGIYDNIRKVVDYLVAGNLSEIAIVVGALIAFPALGVPLLPLQLLWINLLTDGLPALALGADRTDPALMRQPPRSPTQRLLDRRRLLQLGGRGTLMAAPALATVAVTLGTWEYEPDQARTVLLTTLMVTHLLYAFLARQPTTKTRPSPASVGSKALVSAVSGSLALHIVAVSWPPARTVLGTTPLATVDWMLIAGASLLALSATVLFRRVTLPASRNP